MEKIDLEQGGMKYKNDVYPIDSQFAIMRIIEKINEIIDDINEHHHLSLDELLEKNKPKVDQ